MNRRSFILSTGSFAFGAAVGGGFFQWRGQNKPKEPFGFNQIKGSIYGIGMEGGRGPGGHLNKLHRQSVLTEIRFSDGAIKQTLLNMSFGHTVNHFKSRYLFCVPIGGPKIIVTDLDHKVIQEIVTDDDVVFGGHAIYLEEQNVILVSMKAKDYARTVGLAIYDADSFRLLGEDRINARYAHDFVRVPGQKSQVVIAHGIDIRLARPDKFSHIPQEPLLTIYDAQHRKVIQEFSFMPVRGITHLTMDSQNQIYCSQLLSVPITEKSIQDLRTTFSDEREWYWGTSSGRAPDNIPYPSPLYRVSMTGNVEELMSKPGLHLRHQDTTYSSFLKRIFATYSESNTIAFASEKGEINYVHAQDWGLSKVRGIRSIPDTPFLVANDSEMGVAVIDGTTMKVVKFFQSPLYLTRHVSVACSV